MTKLQTKIAQKQALLNEVTLRYYNMTKRAEAEGNLNSLPHIKEVEKVLTKIEDELTTLQVKLSESQK